MTRAAAGETSAAADTPSAFVELLDSYYDSRTLENFHCSVDDVVGVSCSICNPSLSFLYAQMTLYYDTRQQT